MNADDFNLRLQPLHGTPDTADQPSAADGDENHIQRRILLQKFQPERALSRNDLIVIERMDERGVSLLTLLDCRFAGLVIVRAVQDDIRAVGAGRGELDERR